MTSRASAQLRVLVASCATVGCVAPDRTDTGPAWMGDTSPDATGSAESEGGGGSTTSVSGSSNASTPSSSSSPETTDPATTDPDPPDTTGSTSTSSETTGAPSSICDDIAGEDFVPPSTCDGPSGNTTTEIPRNGLYATSWFGCYREDDGSIYQDPYDNCEFACGSQGLCPAGQSGPECEADLQWFAADADRYGCGGRIRVTNCENGNSVILVTLDRGPNCNSVEMECGAPVLDMSHDAMIHLLDGEYGGCDLQGVVVEAVADDTPLGPE
jgi:hypothetical protein